MLKAQQIHKPLLRGFPYCNFTTKGCLEHSITLIFQLVHTHKFINIYIYIVYVILKNRTF